MGLADFEFIDTLSRLEELSEELINEDVIAVDTEADSFYHYFDKTCLVQIGTRKNAYLIDPLAMGGPKELAPLGPVFSSPDVLTLFHAAEYDIYVLKRDCGFEFAGIFDTMVSAQLLGYSSIGLAALIEHHFGVVIPKDEQRSDWSRRPLTERQLNYAVGDVIYLARLMKKLEKELAKAGRREWAQEEFDLLTQRKWPTREFDKQGYLKIKGARKFDLDTLAVLRELFLMRDKRAREIDRPPFKVLGNRTLLELAEEKPSKNAQLARIKGITDLLIRRMGAEILSGETLPAATAVAPLAVDYAKGCYPGQELVERMDSRGADAPKILRLVAVADGAEPGDPIVDALGEEVGSLTSVSGSTALGYVKRGSEVGRPPAHAG